MKILLVDDHAIFRRGLKEILFESLPRVEITEIENGQQLLALLSSRKSWDILISDISMPGRSGIDLLGDIRQLRPDLPVLFLSTHPEDQYAIRVMRAGGAGYVNKAKAPAEIAEAVRKIVEGGRYFSKAVMEQLVKEVGYGETSMPHAKLSDRECEVMRMIAAGKPLKEIAHDLKISVQTVSTHRLRLLNKMRMNSDAELIRYAVEHGLID